MGLKEIKGLYKGRYHLCGKLGRVYFTDSDELFDIKCRKWYCEECLNFLKYMLYFEIVKNVYMFNLQKHFIITFSGKEYRELYTPEESYAFMSKQWNRFRNVINYHYGKIIYILLPRSQKSGYCHYHIITDKYLDWKFLNEKRKKYNLGFVSIQKNKDVAEYLNTDFFKKHEWYIPSNIKHYRCSREIKINDYQKNNNKVYFTNRFNMAQIKKYMFINYGIEINLDSYFEKKLIEKLINE